MSSQTLLLLSPLVAISLGLLVYALYDLSRPQRTVKGGSKLVWLAIIVLVGTFGPLVYLLAGREEA